MRQSDEFWTLVILSFFSGVIGAIVIFGTWEAVKWGSRTLDAWETIRCLTRALRRPRHIERRIVR